MKVYLVIKDGYDHVLDEGFTDIIDIAIISYICLSGCMILWAICTM